MLCFWPPNDFSFHALDLFAMARRSLYFLPVHRMEDVMNRPTKLNRRRPRPLMEALEDRTLLSSTFLSTVVVNPTLSVSPGTTASTTAALTIPASTSAL